MRFLNVRANTRHVGIVALFSLLTVGCASTRFRHVWTDEMLAAVSLQSDGHLDEARTAYAALISQAPDENKRRWLLLHQAELEAQAGKRDVALKMLADIYASDLRDEYGARAMYRTAKLHDEVDSSEARTLRLQVLEKYPNEVAAEFALDDIVDEETKKGDLDELTRLLDRLHLAVAGSEVGDNVLFALAQIEDCELARPDAALATYRRLYAAYSDGPLADDALWEIANIYRRHQRWQPAVEAMTILATDRETSWFIGSYDSAWVDNSIFDLGLIHLLFLDDYETAVGWFELYVEDFGDGFLVDDAGWHIVQANRLAGDQRAYRASLQNFIERYPESRFTPVARERLGGFR